MICRCLSKKTVNVESFLSRVRFVMAAVRRNTTQENHTAHESRTEAAENAENTSPTKDKTKRVWTQNSTAGDVTPNTVNTGFDASRSTDEEKRIYFCHKLACEVSQISVLQLSVEESAVSFFLGGGVGDSDRLQLRLE